MTHALSDSWLKDDLTWDEGEKFDVSWMPGVRVQVLECTPIQWDEKPRQMQKIWIGDAPHVAVITVTHPNKVVMTCSDHDEPDCDCKRIARLWMEK